MANPILMPHVAKIFDVMSSDDDRKSAVTSYQHSVWEMRRALDPEDLDDLIVTVGRDAHNMIESIVNDPEEDSNMRVYVLSQTVNALAHVCDAMTVIKNPVYRRNMLGENFIKAAEFKPRQYLPVEDILDTLYQRANNNEEALAVRKAAMLGARTLIRKASQAEIDLNLFQINRRFARISETAQNEWVAQYARHFEF